uniref:Cadherin domain-containing protein n=1 Tax=Anopheles epiroticus TaxID=199890 RepID=A0A182PD60_9DIPT
MPPSTIFLRETYDAFDKPIAVFEAHSDFHDGSMLVLKLNIETTETSNDKNMFILEQSDNTACIKLTGPVDFETRQEYTITVTASKANALEKVLAKGQVKIRIIDENDNVPRFAGEVTGNVLEHAPPGTFVTQVHAHDRDGTSAHNIVSYRIEGPGKQFFHIDSQTGNITSLVEFDREKKNIYLVTVVAVDNSPSVLSHDGKPNRAERRLFIRVLDTNDHPPIFEKRYYVAENVPENADINTSIIKVKATDQDADSNIQYSIEKNNIGWAFKMDEETGLISVNNQLDYELISEYDLVVKADDGIFHDTAIVRIKVKDLNDNAPKILVLQNVTVPENTLPSGCVANLWAYDPDIKNFEHPQNIKYTLPKEHEHLLSIDSNGCLKLLMPLDRDPPHGFEVLQTNITMTDENGTGKTATETVYIFVQDANDNAPQLAIKQPVVWNENRPSGMITPLGTKDADGEHNGPPFFYTIDSNAPDYIKKRFQTVDDKLYSLVEFDREQQKQYLVPILIRDSGDKPMSAVTNLLVVIGDENDNRMEKGESQIVVHTYEGKLSDTQIGRVYVSDPDDWDLSDKKFFWDETMNEKTRRHFNLNSTTGMITMVESTPQGSYDLLFLVIEESSYFPRHNVSARTTVTVKDISQKIVNQSGSIRFHNVTAEEFVYQSSVHISSPMMRLQQHIAAILNTSPDQVNIFTINNRRLAGSLLLDVFFAVGDSIYTTTEALNGVLSLQLSKLEEDVGYRIVMIGIDECIQQGDICDRTCKNKVQPSHKSIVVHTNVTSFVGITTFTQAECISQQVPPFAACMESIEGPECQMQDISFSGNGYALYPPVYIDHITNISFEMFTRQKDGLVLYMGPLKYNPQLTTQPFTALEIVDATARFEHHQMSLYEATTVHVTLQPQKIEISSVSNNLVSSKSKYENRDMNGYLPGNSSVQLGGSVVSLDKLGMLYNWEYVPQAKSFDGSIRNLTINGLTMDCRQSINSQNVSYNRSGLVRSSNTGRKGIQMQGTQIGDDLVGIVFCRRQLVQMVARSLCLGLSDCGGRCRMWSTPRVRRSTVSGMMCCGRLLLLLVLLVL